MYLRYPYVPARRISTLLLKTLCILCIPVVLITINVRLAFNSVALYEYGFKTYSVTQSTGLDMPQLSRVGQEIREYFNSSEEYLDVDVNWGGHEVALFNGREIMHMWDVKQLVRGVYKGQELVTFYVLMYMGLMILLGRRRGLHYVFGDLVKGSVLTLGILFVFGILGTLAFPVMFQQFHMFSFSNDFWVLDPRYNYLTRLFTEGFFFRAVMFVAFLAALQASLIIVMSLYARRFAIGRSFILPHDSS